MFSLKVRAHPRGARIQPTFEDAAGRCGSRCNPLSVDLHEALKLTLGLVTRKRNEGDEARQLLARQMRSNLQGEHS